MEEKGEVEEEEGKEGGVPFTVCVSMNSLCSADVQRHQGPDSISMRPSGVGDLWPILRKRCRVVMEEEEEGGGVRLNASRKTVPCSLCKISLLFKIAERLMEMPPSC